MEMQGPWPTEVPRGPGIAWTLPPRSPMSFLVRSVPLALLLSSALRNANIYHGALQCTPTLSMIPPFEGGGALPRDAAMPTGDASHSTSAASRAHPTCGMASHVLSHRSPAETGDLHWPIRTGTER
jgi:hypothetical protein